MASTRSSAPSTSAPCWPRPTGAPTSCPRSRPTACPLGDAFQLRDDVLGAFGETTLTGKPVGDDLREGKPTPLMAMATARADRRQAEVLALVGRPDLTAADIERVQEVLVATGALAELESVIDDLAQQALAAIDVADITDDARKALAEMAHYVAWREL